MPGFSPIAGAPIAAAYEAAQVLPDVTNPPPEGEIEAANVPFGRRVFFDGSIRVITFEAG